MEEVNLTIEQLQKLCRLCHRDDEFLINIFDLKLKKNQISAAEKIFTLFQIKILRNDGKPNCVCCRCLYFVNSFYEFRENAHECLIKFDKDLSLVKNKENKRALRSTTFFLDPITNNNDSGEDLPNNDGDMPVKVVDPNQFFIDIENENVKENVPERNVIADDAKSGKLLPRKTKKALEVAKKQKAAAEQEQEQEQEQKLQKEQERKLQKEQKVLKENRSQRAEIINSPKAVDPEPVSVKGTKKVAISKQKSAKIPESQLSLGKSSNTTSSTTRSKHKLQQTTKCSESETVTRGGCLKKTKKNR